MKKMNRLLALLLCLVMVFGVMPNMTFAAATESNVTMNVGATEVDVDETFTVTLSHRKMTVAAFVCGLNFDKAMLECVSIVATDPDYPNDFALEKENGGRDPYVAADVSTVEGANNNGAVGFAVNLATEQTYKEEVVFTVTFKAKQSGSTEISFYENSSGTDGYKGDPLGATTVTISGSSEPVEPTYVWTKVTDVSQLTVGDQVIIVAADYDYALSTNQKTNNRGQAAVTKNGDIITFADDAGVQILTLEEGNFDGSFAFNTSDGYLYAASSSSNHLKTETTLSDNSSWTITIEDGVTTIVAMGTNTRSHMRYNNSSSLFACYGATNTQAAVQLYKRTVVDSTCDHAGATYVAANDATCTKEGNVAHYYCANCFKYFSDAGCTTEIAQADTVIAKSEHSFTGADDRICTACGIYKDGSTLTIDEVLTYGETLASGATTEYKYYVVGTITSVSNTTYGNIYITDDDVNSLYIYGLKQSGVSYGNMETKPVAGDTIKVYGPIQKYGSTIEIVNAELIEHTVPPCDHDSATFHEAVPSDCSVAGTVAHWYCPDCDRYFDQAFTEQLNSIVAELGEHTPSVGDERICSVCGTYIPGSILTIPEASEFGAGFVHNTYSAGKYYVTGTIQSIASTKYGNMTIVDENDNTLYLYGLYSADGETRYDAMTTQPQVGDIITVYGILGQYNDTPQMKNAWMTAHCTHASTKFVPNDDGTHNVVCANTECNHVVNANVPCSDSDDADELCDSCGNDLHVCEHDHYAYINNAEGHVSVCSCGEKLGSSEHHELGEDDCCVCGAWLFTMDYNGGKCSDDPGKDGNEFYFEPGFVYNFAWNEEYCKEVYAKEGYVFAGYAYDAEGENPVVNPTVLNSTTTVYVVWECNHDETVHEYTYTDNGDGTHTVKCACGETLETTEPHDYTTGTSEYTCICGKVKEFTLYVLDNAGTTFTVSVPYGATIRDYIPAEAYTGITYLNKDYKIGYDKFESWVISKSHVTMPAEAVYVTPRVEFHGWYNGSNGWLYCDGSDDYVKSGWTLINHADYLENGTGSDWYYLDPSTGYRAEGLTRVPYPTEKINGVTYAPNAEDIAYAESKGIDFIDKDEAWFIFDENGKFQSNVNGKIEGTYATCYAVDGMIPWHYGLAKITNKYYYFVGDAVYGGNKIANGPVWITRTNGVEGLENGACYYFLGGVQAHNMTDIVDGKYYENGKLMMGAGLVKLETGYIYVRSDGTIVVDAEYYVPANDLGVVSGLYSFDENGYLVDPESTDVNGIVNGYYYKDGKIVYGAGLIKLGDDYYYVRSSGKVATGIYYITNTNGLEGFTSGMKLVFGDDGKLQTVKNGIVDGYYYVNNQVVYGAGLVAYNNGYIYVRSNGQVVTGTGYWITNVNDTGIAAGYYEFDENGMIVIPETYGQTGIIDGYYYEDGKIAYGAGLIEYNNGYIYVRSNGMVATGTYYITNTNGLEGFTTGMKLEFGEDGMMIAE